MPLKVLMSSCQTAPLYRPALAPVASSGRVWQVVWWTRFQESHGGEIEAEKEIFAGEKGPPANKALRTRVTEHNILVIAGYYQRLRMARLAQLLDLSQEEVRQLTWSWNLCVGLGEQQGYACTAAQGWSAVDTQVA